MNDRPLQVTEKRDGGGNKMNVRPQPKIKERKEEKIRGIIIGGDLL